MDNKIGIIGYETVGFAPIDIDPVAQKALDGKLELTNTGIKFLDQTLFIESTGNKEKDDLIMGALSKLLKD